MCIGPSTQLSKLLQDLWDIFLCRCQHIDWIGVDRHDGPNRIRGPCSEFLNVGARG